VHCTIHIPSVSQFVVQVHSPFSKTLGARCVSELEFFGSQSFLQNSWGQMCFGIGIFRITILSPKLLGPDVFRNWNFSDHIPFSKILGARCVSELEFFGSQSFLQNSWGQMCFGIGIFRITFLSPKLLGPDVFRNWNFSDHIPFSKTLGARCVSELKFFGSQSFLQNSWGQMCLDIGIFRILER